MPLARADADAERARRAAAAGEGGATAEARGSRDLGEVEWWLYNGVAGRLTLEPLPSSNGPPSLVLMGRDLRRRINRIGEALQLPTGAIADANGPKPFAMSIGSGVARGLCGPCELGM